MREGAVIVVDWGSTRLRAWRERPGSAELESLTAASGSLFDRSADLRADLEAHLAPWLPDAGLVLGAGMIGSRTGVIDAGYLELPAGPREWSRAGVRAGTVGGVSLVILPGVRATVPRADVIRGEELQVFAALAAGEPDGTFTCPGTHSKWVTTGRGAITAFRTYATGELYAAWSQRSSLTDLLGSVTHEQGGFLTGLDLALAEDETLLSSIFALRALVLTEELEARHALDALSGVLIGHELRHALERRDDQGEVRILADAPLAGRYLEALTHLAVPARIVEPDTPRALLALARGGAWGADA